MSNQLSRRQQAALDEAIHTVLAWDNQNQKKQLPSLPILFFMIGAYARYLAAKDKERPGIRQEMISKLWLAGKWETPYVDFVQQYLPGPTPSTDDFLKFSEFAGDQLELEQRTRFLVSMIHDSFRICGVEMQAKDRAQTDFIVMRSPTTISELDSLIINWDYDHPAWTEFRERFAASLR